jgi:hypothetical protein
VRARSANALEPSGRAPDNELFDRACDLLEAAGAIRRLAADPRSARAVPGLLGCIEASLDELAAASATLQSGDLADSAVIDATAEARRRRGLGNLRVALADAAGAAQAARALTARVLNRIASE